jgi:hypothetical protein
MPILLQFIQCNSSLSLAPEKNAFCHSQDLKCFQKCGGGAAGDGEILIYGVLATSLNPLDKYDWLRFTEKETKYSTIEYFA